MLDTMGNEEVEEAIALLAKVVLVMDYLISAYLLYDFYPVGMIALTITVWLTVYYLAE